MLMAPKRKNATTAEQPHAKRGGGERGAGRKKAPAALGTQSVTIPVDEIIEEWRAQSQRGRYEAAMWRAAGLEEMAAGWTNTGERQQQCWPLQHW